jgi:hypothetical protein
MDLLIKWQRMPQMMWQKKTLASLTKEERYAKYLKEQGYEGYINPDDLPSIQMGSKDKSSLPTIQIGDTPTRKSNVPGDFTYEPIKNTTPTGTTTMADNVAQTIDRPQIEVPTTTVEKVNKIQKNLNEFESQTNAEQISKIESMDEQLVKDIALGKKPPVDGIPSTAYLAVMENRANELAKNGDYSLALELADSNIGKKAGQNLQAMSIASKDSFTGIIRDIKSTLEERIPKTAKKNQLKEVQSIRDNLNNALNSIDVIKPPKNMIEKALSELICK